MMACLRFTSTGGNDHFDNPYSDLALKFALETAAFNFLRQTNTKVPQTESGMNGLKNAYTQVLERFIRNGLRLRLALGLPAKHSAIPKCSTRTSKIPAIMFTACLSPCKARKSVNSARHRLCRLPLNAPARSIPADVIVLVND